MCSGHAALDRALSGEATRHAAGPTLEAIREATRRSKTVTGPVTDAPARGAGVAFQAISVSADRNLGCCSDVLHVAVDRRAIGRDGRVRTIRVWVPLAQQSWN